MSRALAWLARTALLLLLPPPPAAYAPPQPPASPQLPACHTRKARLPAFLAAGSMSIADLKFSDDVEQPGAVYETQRLTDGAAGSSGRAAFEVETAEHKPRGGSTDSVDSNSCLDSQLVVVVLLALTLVLLPQLPPARAVRRSVLLPLHAFTTMLASSPSWPSAC